MDKLFFSLQSHTINLIGKMYEQLSKIKIKINPTVNPSMSNTHHVIVVESFDVYMPRKTFMPPHFQHQTCAFKLGC